MKQIKLKQEDYPEIDFVRIENIESVEVNEGKMIIHIKMKE